MRFLNEMLVVVGLVCLMAPPAHALCGMYITNCNSGGCSTAPKDDCDSYTLGCQEGSLCNTCECQPIQKLDAHCKCKN